MIRRSLVALVTLGSLAGPALAAEPQTILVLKSRALDAYEAPIAALREELPPGLTVRAMQLEGSDELDVIRRATETHPTLIVALGGRALYTAQESFPKDTPVVFAMVLQPERFLRDGRTNVCGISLEVPPEMLFTQLMLISPRTRRIGVLHHASGAPQPLAAAARRARAMGLEVVPIAVDGPGAAADGFEAHRERVDALWMLPDPRVYDTGSYRALAAATRRHGVPFMAFSRLFVEAGALFSVAPSYTAIGSQLALTTRRILEDGASPSQLGTSPPIGTELTINATVAAEIRLELSPEVLDSADEIVGGDAP